MVKVEPIRQPVKVGEGPHWDEKEQVLYFVDVSKGTINKYDPATNIQTSVKVGPDGKFATVVVPVEGKQDQFVIAMGRSVILMTWDGKSSTPAKMDTLCTVHDKDGKSENRFNDGKVDPTGRFWAGTFGMSADFSEVKEKGCLFSFSKDWKPTVRLPDVSFSNGMAWSPDMKTMYFIDSFAYNVQAFDFNAHTGDLSNRRVAFDFKANNLTDILPDGMTVDTEGNIWVACFGGGRVVHVDPTSGKLLNTISLPSPQTTSVTFGGPNLDELYVTTANVSLKGIKEEEEENLKKYPLAGHTFHVTGVGAKGLPAKNVQLS